MNAFDAVMDWIQLDVILSQDEMATLKASFSMAAENETPLMLVSGRTRTVAIFDRKACFIESVPMRENNLTKVAKGRFGSCVNRDGFFLFNVVEYENPFAESQLKMTMRLLYDAAPPDRKMNIDA